ncbi:type II secretion system protein GspD [Acidaminococcus fermentans]|uniref:type II secretion system protein GspD n=1 Tax=Acidaminococcus fermentans TaxID=905 RepID=UPI00242CEDDF|nr:type II and III secretion system protein [Acidaminococcus fermentans]MDD6286763.1 type II and III secretion system protein [Acidaminococcus fermentans]
MKLLLLFCIFCIFTPVRWVLAAEPLSLSVQEAPVRDVLQSMAQMAGRNLVLDSQIPGTLSLEIQQLPFAQALEMVTRSQGLCFREEGNTLWVASPERMDALYGRLTVHPLEYISARETAETLKPLFSAPLAWSRDANAILFHGSPGEENRLKEALQALDRPTRQITLEARILSLGESASRELGLQWDWSALPEGRKKGEGGFGGRLHLGHSYGASFQARLSALCQEGKAKVLATPRIITLPGREASIFIGDHIPVVTEKVTNSTTTSTTEYVDAGIRLSYTPYLSQDGLITAKVHTEVSTPTLIAELKNYRITSRTADTHVRLREKETLVIGGLISEQEQHRMEAIPLLSKLPLLGELFKFRSRSRNRTEVCMFLTPYLSGPGQPLPAAVLPDAPVPGTGGGSGQ